MNPNDSERGNRSGLPAIFAPLLLICCLASAPAAADCGCEGNMKAQLAQPVSDFDNRGAPLIPTLLLIADVYNLPMGIERVTQEALERPVEVKLEDGTLSRLLDICMAQLPGYTWTMRDGVVNVFGEQELTQASNLFNLVVPSFEVHQQDLNDANSDLRMTVLFLKERPAGVVGSYVGSSEFKGQPLTFAARNLTVREILNGLVRLHGKSVWIARVPPEGLSRLPQAGLWQLLPHSTHDPRGLLDPQLKPRPQKEGDKGNTEKTNPVHP